MIRPVLVPITPNLLPSLGRLFAACDQAHVKEWVFNPRRCVLALWQDEVVGFVASWWDKQPFAWIDLLLVHPKYHGQGIGVALCWTMEELLRSEGVKAIRCVLDDTAEIAGPLERAGFARIGTPVLMEKVYVHEVEAT